MYDKYKKSNIKILNKIRVAFNLNRMILWYIKGNGRSEEKRTIYKRIKKEQKTSTTKHY